MFEKVLSSEAKSALAILGKEKFFRQDAYLAGGTAIALQLGHRFSYDLDFFSPTKFSASTMRRYLETTVPKFRLQRWAWGTVVGFVGDFHFSLFFYEYPLLYKPVAFSGVKVATLKDLAAMKIAAISERGTKRDFVDLYCIAKEKELSLRDTVLLFQRKYHTASDTIPHILKSLTYFEDAEKEKMPVMIEKISWEDIKKFFLLESPKTFKFFVRA